MHADNLLPANKQKPKKYTNFMLISRNESKISHAHLANVSAGNGIYSNNRNECVHSSNDPVASLLQFLSRKTTKLHSSNEISTKCCRPHVERIVHLLKQSMLGANGLEHPSSLHNGIAQECYLQLSRKLLDSSFVERYVPHTQVGENRKTFVFCFVLDFCGNARGHIHMCADAKSHRK